MRATNRMITPFPEATTVSGATSGAVTVQPSGVRKLSAPDGWRCSRGSGGGWRSFFGLAAASGGVSRASAARRPAQVLREQSAGRIKADAAPYPRVRGESRAKAQEHGFQDPRRDGARLVRDARRVRSEE